MIHSGENVTVIVYFPIPCSSCAWKLVALPTQGMNDVVNLHTGPNRLLCLVKISIRSFSLPLYSQQSQNDTHCFNTQSAKQITMTFFFLTLCPIENAASPDFGFLYRRITFWLLPLTPVWVVPALKSARSLGVFLGIWNFYTERGGETLVQR